MGADVEQEDNDSNTPLILAATNGHFEASKLLIKNSADVNRKG